MLKRTLSMQKRLLWGAFGLLLLFQPVTVAQSKKDVPIWQFPPFDRVELIDDETIDVEPDRLPIGLKFEVEVDEYIGVKGLPPVRELKRNVRYRVTRKDDGEEFYVLGRSIKNIQLYEDMLLQQAVLKTKQGKFDESHEYLAALEARDPKWPGLRQARVDDRQREHEYWIFNGNFDKALACLMEERRLCEAPVPAGEKKIAAVDTLGRPVKDRIEDVGRRWLESLAAVGNFAESRRVVARLESAIPESVTAAKWRKDLARRAGVLVSEASEKEKAGDLRAADSILQKAISIVPDDPKVKEAATSLHERFKVLRVAVERSPAYRTGLAGWTSADWRASDLIHVPIMRIKGTVEKPEFQSQVVRSLEKSNINKRATIELREGLVWPGDDKPVTIVDVQRLLADSCQPGAPLYHPALARLVINLEASFPRSLAIDFDRPQFQPAAWLEIPFLRMASEPASAAGVDFRIGLRGMGPFRLVEQDAEQTVFLANTRFV